MKKQTTSTPTLYWISTGGQSRGTYTLEQIRSMYRSGAIPATTQVCANGSEMWAVVTEVLSRQASSSRISVVAISLLLIAGLALAWMVVGELVRVDQRQKAWMEDAAKPWAEREAEWAREKALEELGRTIDR